MRLFDLVIAQNGMGKSFICVGDSIWAGEHGNPDLCWYQDSQFGRVHDVFNWAPYLKQDEKFMLKRVAELSKKWDIMFFINSVWKVENLEPFSNLAIVVYSDISDGARRWYDRDPSMFRNLQHAEDAVAAKKDRLVEISRSLPKRAVSLLELDKGYFLSDILEEYSQKGGNNAN